MPADAGRVLSRPSDQAVQIALTLLREADPGCVVAYLGNGYADCDHVSRQLAELTIDRFKPCERNTYHPETGRYAYCLSCQIRDLFAAMEAENA